MKWKYLLGIIIGLLTCTNPFAPFCNSCISVTLNNNSNYSLRLDSNFPPLCYDSYGSLFWLTIFPEIRGNISCHAEVLTSLWGWEAPLLPDWTAVLGYGCCVLVIWGAAPLPRHFFVPTNLPYFIKSKMPPIIECTVILCITNWKSCCQFRLWNIINTKVHPASRNVNMWKWEEV